MNLKRISAAALALAVTASLATASLAADLPDGWTPADGARGPAADNDVMPINAPEDELLIAPAPGGSIGGTGSDIATGDVATMEIPQVNVPAPNGGYKTALSINGKALESFDFDYEVAGWGSQTVTWKINELDTVPAGYVPMRAIVQADKGSCFWDPDAYESWFFFGDFQIIANFNDMSVKVNDEPVEGAEALLLHGVTYLPVSVIDSLEGYEVVDNSADGVESYDIKTPNGTPLIMLATEIMEAAGMGAGMRTTPAEMEDVYGEAMGFKAEYIPEGIIYLPMMINPDTLALGKMAEGKADALKESFELFRQTQEDTFTWYLSHNLPKVQNAKFVTSGDWFMFLIAENVDEAVAVFEAAVAEMAE